MGTLDHLFALHYEAIGKKPIPILAAILHVLEGQNFRELRA